MSEMWMFVGTIAAGCVVLAVANPVLRAADNATLRAGLWLNGIERAERERIMKWHKTGRLAE